MISWLKKNKLEILILGIILIVALFFRLYRIEEFMTYLGDEGRDVRIVRDLITEGNLVFIGPQTSVGNMYLGPLYYYLMAPALFLSGLSPVGPAIMVALLSVLTVFLTWFVARKWFGKVAAIFSALLYAISPIAIIYGRTSWNPNPLPLFSLLSIWGIYQVWHTKKYFWLSLIGVFMAFALQMHYLALLLLPTIGLFWFYSLKKTKAKRQSFVKNSLLGAFFFLFLMSPLVLFDIKHQGMNLAAFVSLFSAKSGVFNLGHLLVKPFSLLALVFSSLLTGKETPQILVTLLISIVTVSYLFLKRYQAPVKIITAWLFFSLLGLSLYNQPIYIHYLGLVYPLVFILVGAILALLLKKGPVISAITLTLVILLVTNSLQTSPAFGSPNRQLQRTEEVVDLIIRESKGEPFNLGLIAKNNYDQSYRYFLENKKSSLEPDQNRVTRQLFVICEDGEACKPEGHSQYQIAVFGIAHVSEQWSIDGIKIYRLIH